MDCTVISTGRKTAQDNGGPDHIIHVVVARLRNPPRGTLSRKVRNFRSIPGGVFCPQLASSCIFLLELLTIFSTLRPSGSCHHGRPG